MFIIEGIVSGHYISIKGIDMDPTKFKLILTILTLRKQKNVRSFLGKVGFYQIFIINFSIIIAPLNKILTKDALFEWTDQYE